MDRGIEIRRQVVGTLIAAGSALGLVACGDPAAIDMVRGNEAGTAATSTTVGGECVDSWAMTGLDNAGHRIVAQGIPALGSATNEAEARNALGEWVGLISSDAEVLAGYSKELVDAGDVDTATLVDAEGCATPAAENLRSQIEAKIAMSAVSTSKSIDSNAVNTGVGDDGRVVAASQPGINGNTMGIEVISEGDKWGVMQRCGNLVIFGLPKAPHGPTDEEFPGVTTKNDPNNTAAGAPGQNGGTPSRGGGGVGMPGQGTIPAGNVPGENVAPAPPEERTNTDPDGETQPASGGGETGTPNTAPVAPINDGGTGNTQTGEQGGGGGAGNSGNI